MIEYEQESGSNGTRKMRSLSRSLPMMLLLARESLMARFRPLLREHDLTEQQWRVLRALADAREADISAVSKITCILLPSLSRIVQNLEERGLIVRRKSLEDQRYSMLSMSERGRALFDHIAPQSAERYAEAERLIGKERMEQLHDLLADVANLLAKADAEDETAAERDGGKENMEEEELL